MGMGATKRFWDHINVSQTTGGIATAYTLTYDVAPQSLWKGELFGATVNVNSGTHPTLNINALGGKSLRRFDGTAWQLIEANELMLGQVIFFYYNSTALTYDIIAGFHDAAFSGGTLTNTTTMSGAAFNEADWVDVATAATAGIFAAASNNVRLTGTTSITAFDTITGGAHRYCRAAASFTLTYDATVLILPTKADIVVQPGDTFEAISLGSGHALVFNYQRLNGGPVGSTPATFSIPTDIALPDITQYVIGPTLTLGVGVWFVSGGVTLVAGAANRFNGRLKITGGAVLDSRATVSITGGQATDLNFSGRADLPAGGTVVIEINDPDGTSGLILANQSGNAKDSTITAYRIG